MAISLDETDCQDWECSSGWPTSPPRKYSARCRLIRNNHLASDLPTNPGGYRSTPGRVSLPTVSSGRSNWSLRLDRHLGPIDLFLTSSQEDYCEHMVPICVAAEYDATKISHVLLADDPRACAAWWVDPW